MTGFGEAHRQQDGLAVAVEVRAVNSRFFKLVVRTGDAYGALESHIEAVVRKSIRRGTIQVNLTVDRTRSPEDYKINTDVLNRYRLQLESLQKQWNMAAAVSLDALLALPGVVEDGAGATIDPTADWPLIAQTFEAALENLTRMRVEEGRAMAADLEANCRTATESLGQIERRAPRVVDAYRRRLEQRLKTTLAEYDVVLDPADVIREVSLFADRGDISEEIVRLRSHLEQFGTMLKSPESSGRKIEFLTQEMLRETNTIGSKASDVEIARHVIDIKAALERIREVIQNIE